MAESRKVYAESTVGHATTFRSLWNPSVS